MSNFVALEEICTFVNGGTPSRKNPDFFRGNIPWITGADVTDNYVVTAREYITEKAIEASSTHLISKGNILLVTRTGVGKVAIAGVDVCISQDFTGLILDKSQVDSLYLLYYLKQKQEYFVSEQRGATIQGITRETVASLKVYLPSLPEQQRIAALLDRADRLRRTRRYAQQLSDSFLQAVFVKMFGDPRFNSRSRDMGIVEDAVAFSQYGTSNKSNSEKRGYPVLGMGNITYGGQVDLNSLSYVELEQKEFQDLRLERGDIIFNRTNSTELVGKTAMWNLEMDAVVASYLVKLRLKEDVIPEYFVSLLNSLYFKRLFQERCKKAVGQSNVSPTLLKEFPMPFPPFSLQQKFAHIVHQFDRLRAQQREAERQAEHLFQTLLHRAFRGQL